APAGAPRTEAVRMRSLDRLDQDNAVAAAAGAADDAERDLAAARRDLAAKRRSEVRAGATVTAIPTPGTVVERGGVLFTLDGQPTVPLIGDTPVYPAHRE